MTEKVKVTAEQARAIGLRIHKESAIRHHVEDTWVGEENRCLNDLTLDEFVRALYIGYEVGPEYKVGDTVKYYSPSKDCYVFGVCTDVFSNKVWAKWGESTSSTWIEKNVVEKATPEEIKAIQERELWAKIGRKVGEFIIGDKGVYDGDSGAEMCMVNTLIDVKGIEMMYRDGDLKGFYPAGSFIEFGGGEE